MPTFLLVDDHPLFRKGLKQMILDAYPQSECLESCGISEAIEVLNSNDITVIILDVNLADGNGIQFLREQQALIQQRKVILLTMFNDKMLIQEGFSLGISAYLSKESAVDELEVCLEKVLSGQKYMNQAVMNTLASNNTETSLYQIELDNLTKTEKSILNLVSESLSSKEIAEKLGVSYRTVENHRSNICSKLGLKGVNALTRFVLENKSFIS
jgi:DNA-binding NarL/FixJ family response regulator